MFACAGQGRDGIGRDLDLGEVGLGEAGELLGRQGTGIRGLRRDESAAQRAKLGERMKARQAMMEDRMQRRHQKHMLRTTPPTAQPAPQK